MKTLILAMAFLIVTALAPAMTSNVYIGSFSCEMQRPKPPPRPHKAPKPPKPRAPRKPQAPRPVNQPKPPPKPPWVN